MTSYKVKAFNLQRPDKPTDSIVTANQGKAKDFAYQRLGKGQKVLIENLDTGEAKCFEGTDARVVLP